MPKGYGDGMDVGGDGEECPACGHRAGSGEPCDSVDLTKTTVGTSGYDRNPAWQVEATGKGWVRYKNGHVSLHPIAGETWAEASQRIMEAFAPAWEILSKR